VLAAHNAQPASRLRAYLLVSVDRRNTLAEAQEAVELAARHCSSGGGIVVGVDLCGDPSRVPVAHLAPAFARARAAGLKVTLHFAEAAGPALAQELPLLMGWWPHRLGHVIHVPLEVREEIVRRSVGVELCLSCNVHAKMLVGAAGYEEHHFGWWKDSGVGVALCVSFSVLVPLLRF